MQFGGLLFLVYLVMPAIFAEDVSYQACVDKYSRKGYQPWQEWSDHYTCHRYRCEIRDGKYFIAAVGCRKPKIPENALECHEYIEDENVEFPTCCARLRCVVEVNGERIVQTRGQPGELFPDKPWKGQQNEPNPAVVGMGGIPPNTVGNEPQGQPAPGIFNSRGAGKRTKVPFKMTEPEKPFACSIPDCGMTFTNEDHLHVHTKKHDMMLQFGPEQKAAFVADQTPTPTRFIRNCEEVGLFQDLQNVNPFDEGFKRAMETKHGILSLENMTGSDDLHTPQMVYPLDSGDSTLFSTTNNQRNITISRSSSDESGAIKEFETTTISKLTNEVTTISRIVGKHDDTQKPEDHTKDGIRKDSVSYTNNVIKIHSNVEIRKDNIEKNPIQTLISYEDTIIKDSIVTKDVLLTDNRLLLPDVPPIMSQKSIDRVVDSLTADFNKEDYSRRNKKEDYEVIIKLPNGKKVRMKSVEEVDKTQTNAKEKLKMALTEKAESKIPFQRINSVTNPQMLSNLVPISTGTLIPVTILNQNHLVQKIPIQPLPVKVCKTKKPVKRKKVDAKNSEVPKTSDVNSANGKIECQVRDVREVRSSLAKQDLDSKSAASRRYRARLKETWSRQNDEIRQLRDSNERLREANERLTDEKALLQVLITEHMKRCPNANDLRNIQEKLRSGANLSNPPNVAQRHLHNNNSN